MKASDASVEFTTMSSITHASFTDMLSISAMVAFVTPGHDHHWARDLAAERRAYSRVADAALIPSPRCLTHDDIHYAS